MLTTVGCGTLGRITKCARREWKILGWAAALLKGIWGFGGSPTPRESAARYTRIRHKRDFDLRRQEHSVEDTGGDNPTPLGAGQTSSGVVRVALGSTFEEGCGNYTQRPVASLDKQ